MKWLIPPVTGGSLILASLVPLTVAMPFIHPLHNDSLIQEDGHLVTYQSGLAQQFFNRDIDELEAIAFSNTTFYSVSNDTQKNQQESNTCSVDHMAPYVPIMPQIDFLRMASDEKPQNAKSASLKFSADETQNCPTYDASRYTIKASSVQSWWKRQKSLDQKSIDKLGPSPLQARFPTAPRFVNYECCGDDSGEADLPTAEELGPINVLNLAFMTLRGPEGSLRKFFRMSVAQRRKWIHSLHVAGISLMMSTFGADDRPPLQGRYDPVALGKLHGEIARESGFDGLDNDWEDFDGAQARPGAAAGWIEAYVKAVRSQMPVRKYAFTAAPVAPWFTTNKDSYCSNFYLAIDRNVGHLHDWYNLQYYNQDPGTYENCASVLTQSDMDGYEDTSIFQIHKNGGVDLQKLVIGKPSPGEATSGYMRPSHIAKCVEEASSKGWHGGVMTFQFPQANANWFKTIRKNFYPPR